MLFEIDFENNPFIDHHPPKSQATLLREANQRNWDFDDEATAKVLHHIEDKMHAYAWKAINATNENDKRRYNRKMMEWIMKKRLAIYN